jgi:hypothetical protein
MHQDNLNSWNTVNAEITIFLVQVVDFFTE